MPDDAKGPIPVIDVINAGLGQVLTSLPLILGAYQILYLIWKKMDPTLTFADYNQRLLDESVSVKDFSAQWLESHGYVKQPDGTWKPPEA